MGHDILKRTATGWEKANRKSLAHLSTASKLFATLRLFEPKAKFVIVPAGQAKPYFDNTPTLGEFILDYPRYITTI
jgi:hypothetical protein